MPVPSLRIQYPDIGNALMKAYTIKNAQNALQEQERQRQYREAVAQNYLKQYPNLPEEKKKMVEADPAAAIKQFQSLDERRRKEIADGLKEMGLFAKWVQEGQTPEEQQKRYTVGLEFIKKKYPSVANVIPPTYSPEAMQALWQSVLSAEQIIKQATPTKTVIERGQRKETYYLKPGQTPEGQKPVATAPRFAPSKPTQPSDMEKAYRQYVDSLPRGEKPLTRAAWRRKHWLAPKEPTEKEPKPKEELQIGKILAQAETQILQPDQADSPETKTAIEFFNKFSDSGHIYLIQKEKIPHKYLPLPDEEKTQAVRINLPPGITARDFTYTLKKHYGEEITLEKVNDLIEKLRGLNTDAD